MIFLDNASTTKPYDECLEVYKKYASNHFFNASSLYKVGKDNDFLNERIKKEILNALKLSNKKIIFTSSATEANNLAILGYLGTKQNKSGHLITSKIEHKSILETFKKLETQGYSVSYLDVDSSGRVDIKTLEKTIRKDTLLASFMYVNNETGSVLNIKEISDVLKRHKIILHSDIVQSLFKIESENYDYLNMITISSHKIHGLKSIAALIVDNNMNLEPIINGGGQEYGMRSSTVDTPLIASFWKAIELSKKNKNINLNIVSQLFDYTHEKIAERDYLQFNSQESNQSKYIINFSFLNNIKSSVVLEYLSNKGIYVSTSSACNSKGEPISYVIDNMFSDAQRAKNTLRISFSSENTKEEIDILFNEIDKCVKETLWNI